MMKSLTEFLGIEADTTGLGEKLLSGLGGFVGIYAILLITGMSLDGMAVPVIVASMGASAVLLFAAPHGVFSQPWNLLAGHGISALIGVTCATLIPDAMLAAPAAVGLAISAMYLLRCIHPPGGASALMAVIGGDSIHALGYQYVLTPVLINAGVILLGAVAFNYLFNWRRYPPLLARSTEPDPGAESGPLLGSEDIEYALHEMGGFMDVLESDLEQIFRIAQKHARSHHLSTAELRLGKYYSNGELGSRWSVRQVIDAPDGELDAQVILMYKVVAGDQQGSTGSCTGTAMAEWARYEVLPDGDSWRQI